MKCPYCDNEMLRGYIQCRDGVNWTSKKHWVAALSAFGKDAIPLGKDDGPMMNITAVAYNFEQCKKVIIEY